MQEMASGVDSSGLSPLRKWLHFVDNQIDKEGLECLKLALYGEVKYSQISKMAKLKPSDLFYGLKAMQKGTNPTEAALSKFVYCLRSIGSSCRGKWCVIQMKEYQVSEVDPLDITVQTPEFIFANQCLLKVYRNIRETEGLRRYFGKKSILGVHHRNFDSTPHMFIMLLQQRKITPNDQYLLINALKVCEAKHCLVYVREYRRKAGLCDLEEIEAEFPDDNQDIFSSPGPPVTEDIFSSSGPPMSEDSEWEKAETKSQRSQETRKRMKFSKDTGSGEVHKSGSLHAFASGSATSSGTLVPSDLQAHSPKINEVESDAEECYHPFQKQNSPTSSIHPLLNLHQVPNVAPQDAGDGEDIVPKQGKIIWCRRIAALVTLTTLMATVIGFVLTSKVENDVNTGLITTAYGGTTMVVQSINQFYIKSVLAREDIQHKDIPQQVQFILADMECSNLPLLNITIETTGTMVENQTGLYLMHGSYISFNICASANHTSPERGEVFILNNLTEARFFDPQRDSEHLCFKSFAIGHSQDKQHPWTCTPVDCHINSDGYYSVVFLDPSYPVQYNYTSNIFRKYIDLSSLQSSWNCTVYDEDDQCHQEWPWATAETCLIARVGSNGNQKYFTHIAVDLTLQVGVLILGYVFSCLSLLIFIISMIFCCLGYKKQLRKIKNVVV